jgi:PAS domain-containing protein
LTEATNLALLNAMPDWVFRIGRDGRYLDFHGAANNSLLMPPEQFLGKTSHEVMPKEIADKTLEAIEKALADGNVVAFEYELEVGGAVRSFGCRITACGPDEVLAIVAEKGG